MDITEARAIRQGEADLARDLRRRTRPALDTAYRAAGHDYSSMSKDELVSALVRERYSLSQVNEAIHVLHHKPGECWSACDHCSAAVQAAMDVLAGQS